MGLLTRVREHRRKNAPHVSEYTRGNESRVVKFEGGYQESGSSRFDETSPSVRERISKRLAMAREARLAKEAMRRAIRAEEEAKAHEIRLKHIRAEEKLRARHGRLPTRLAKAGAKRSAGYRKYQAKYLRLRKEIKGY